MTVSASTSGMSREGKEARYKAVVPASIQTPDTVQTGLPGALKFFDGMPDQATVRKTYDFIDVSQAAEAFLNGIPAASVYAAFEGSSFA